MEAGDAAFFVQVVEASAGQNLVGVALMADVEDQFVFWEVEIPVNRHRELHDPKVRREVSAIFRGLLDDLGADVLAEQVQRTIPHLLHDIRALNAR